MSLERGGNNQQGAQAVYTPSELNREVRLHIEAGFPRILLEGEISNLSRPASGHLYFSLKDERAQVRCALFRSSAAGLKIAPKNGMLVVARGRISLYESRGDFQMIVDGLRDAGEGLLRQQFEALQKKLAAEGLFDDTLKKTLPRYPRRIEIITSPSGAAIRDILQVLERRWPLAAVRLRGVPVQGDEAAPALVNALRAANRSAWADVIILGRGGGSLEDLWAFNEESVVRAVHASVKPIVSAVGHETDVALTDFAADVRAPTPSAAAEIVAPEGKELSARFVRFARQISRRTENVLIQHSQRLDHLSHRLSQRHPSKDLDQQHSRLSGAVTRLERATTLNLQGRRSALRTMNDRLNLADPRSRIAQQQLRVSELQRSLLRSATIPVSAGRAAVAALARTLQAVSPLQTIGRGYAALLDGDGNEVITSVSRLEIQGRLTAQLADGRAKCVVKEITDETL